MTVTVDKYTRVMLTIIAVLLFVLSTAMWFETPNIASTAQARIPDSGQQLNQLIEKTQQINESIADLTTLMTSGKIKVQIVEPAQKTNSAAQAVPPAVQK